MRRPAALSMRAFAWLSAASLAVAAPAEASAPVRAASLNLCTDELLLLLAGPGQAISVSHLSQMEAETPLWRHARRLPANDGSLLSVAPMRPDLVLSMGGAGRDRIGIARRLGIRTLDLPFPAGLSDIESSIREVASALGRPHAGAALIARIEALRRSAPPARLDAVVIGGGGRSIAPDGVAAQWLALAGLRQRPLRDNRISLEELLLRPPQVLVRSDYRQNQYSSGQRWLDHPLARNVRAARVVRADGRRWTCAGPLMVDEIHRLRAGLAR
jgi:iron complex transport system substrate-binding protein